MAFSLLRDLIDTLGKKRPAAAAAGYKPLVEGLSYAMKDDVGVRSYVLHFEDREMLSFARSVVGVFLTAQEFAVNLQAAFRQIYSKLEIAEKSPTSSVNVELSEDEMVDFFGLFDELNEETQSLTPIEIESLGNIHTLMYNNQLMEKNAAATQKVA
jgi:hypothetical protein